MSWPDGAGPRIAIVGGGIGGLAAAAFLHQAGLPAVVYEQAGELREVGAGLVIAPNAARLLRRLGVLDALAREAVRLETGWEFRRWRDGTVLSSEDLAAGCERRYGEHTYTVHRAGLLGAIRLAVPGEAVRLGKRCTGIDAGGERPVLRFADGEVAEADVVVGADGVHSVIRGAVTTPSPAAYSGLCAFRALVPAGDAPEFARRPAQTLWIGPGHHLVHYPVSSGRLINLVAFAPAGQYTTESWTATATVGEFRSEFDGWDGRLTSLIEASGQPGRWALLDRAPLARWSRGGVTLLGDAAHPMFPFFAQGAAQSIEDAAVLARCLAESASAAGLAAALRRYETLRLPRTTRLQQVSRGRAHVNHLPDGPGQRARDAAFAAADPLAANGWIYGYDPDRGHNEHVPKDPENLTLVYPRDPLPEGSSVFLAGPTPRSDDVPSWRPDAIKQLAAQWRGPGRLAVLIPEPPDGQRWPYFDEQAEWETIGRDGATAILFWVPRDMQKLPGLTTNVEFGLDVTTGRAVLGCPPDCPDPGKNRYLIWLARRHGVPVTETLPATVAAALEIIAKTA